MSPMDTSRFAESADGPSAAHRSRYTVAVTECELYGLYLCVQYVASPVPPQLVGEPEMHEGGEAGIAVDARRRVYRECHSAYRTSETGARVIGALKIGPAPWRGAGRVRVLFAPFAHTPELRGNLCELQVIIDSSRVRASSIRPA